MQSFSVLVVGYASTIGLTAARSRGGLEVADEIANE
jgi:hypothetical protein